MPDAKDAPALVADEFPEPPPTIVRSRIAQKYRERMTAAVEESQANAAKKDTKNDRADASATTSSPASATGSSTKPAAKR